jgi:F-type H+-transporting ATPase subunit delta
MSDSRAAHRYATAIADATTGPEELEQVYGDFRSIGEMLQKVREFPLFLRNPLITAHKKKRVLEALLEGRVGPLTLKFVLLLASKGRELLLPGILRQFTILRDKRLGILNITVRTAVAFTPEEEASLVKQLEQTTGKKARMMWVLDRSLIGGFVVELEDTVWDASVRHQLEALKIRLVEGAA